MPMNLSSRACFLTIGCMAVALIVLNGCGNSSSNTLEPIDRLEVYSRDFSSLAPMSFSDEDLIRSAPIHVTTKNSSNIDGFIMATPTECIKDAGVNAQEMAVYFLIRKFKSVRWVGDLRTSPFKFDTSSH